MACCPCWEGVFGTGDAKLELKNRKVPVSALILGCAPIGCGWAGDVPESTAESTVLQALSLGIRYVDTAPWYGAGLSEQRLGKALATAQSTTKEQVAVSTKVGRYMVTKAEAASHGTRVDSGYDFNTENYHNNVPVWDYRKEGTEESLRQSRQRLQRNFIDCLRVHDAEDPERWEEACSPDGAIAVLVSLREKGEIGQVSLGFNSVPYLMKTIQKYPNGTFDNIMMARTWNLLDQSSYPLLLECQKRGIKVHLAAVFCAGLLWGQNFFMYRSEIPPELTEKVARWKELSTSYGFSLPQVALAFAFLPSCVERVAVGCASPEQVRGNVELCDVKVPLELCLRRTIWALCDGMKSFLVLLCIGVNGFQCPSGYGGVKECLGEGNKGHCDLEMPMNVKAEGCMEPQKLAALAPKGKYWQGCGAKDAGLEDACCNCWPMTRLRSKVNATSGIFECMQCDGKCCTNVGEYFWCRLGGTRCNTPCPDNCG